MSIEVPLVEGVHHLQDLRPLAHIHIDDLLKAFFFLLDLVLILLFAFSM